MKRLPFMVVDAFAQEPFTGNPAAVVFDADDLSDATMHALAAEFNHSETTFVFRPESPQADARIRWFTPAAEVEMCGHGTIAAVHALMASGRIPRGDRTCGLMLKLETNTVTLTCTVEPLDAAGSSELIWLYLPDPRLTDAEADRAAVAQALPLDPAAMVTDYPCVRTQDGDLILMVQDVVALNAIRPDHGALAGVMRRRLIRGVCVATVQTLSTSVHVQSRFFAPALGVDEDPVTGSVHGPLAVYLVRQGLLPREGNLFAARCVQAKAGVRAGLVYALVEEHEGGRHSVRIAGHAVTTMEGMLRI